VTQTTIDVDTAISDVFTGTSQALADPYPFYRALQTAGPVHWLPARTGHGSWTDAWHVLGYDEVAAALRDRRLGAHRLPSPPASLAPPTPAQQAMAELGRIFGLTLLYLDPPDHTRLRLLTAQTFTRRVGESLRPQIQLMADGLLDAVAARGAVDIVEDLARPLPLLVVADLLGIPEQDRPALAEQTGGLFTLRPTAQAMTNALASVHSFRALLQARRRAPGDDLISDLLRAQEADSFLTDDEVIAQSLTVLIAGTETTTAAIANGVLTMLRYPAIWQTLSPRTVGAVVEELLRFDGPTHLLPRQAREDIEIGGCRINAGQRIWLWLAAANRDPARFTRADALVPDRQEARHLAFGSGLHACIGAMLARLELEVCLLSLRERFPALRLTDPDIIWSPNPTLRCPEVLRTALT
jgi:cytochrome P450